MWDLTVLVPNRCLSILLYLRNEFPFFKVFRSVNYIGSCAK